MAANNFEKQTVSMTLCLPHEYGDIYNSGVPCRNDSFCCFDSHQNSNFLNCSSLIIRMADQNCAVVYHTMEISETEFRAAVDPLLENGVPVDQWTKATIYEQSITVKPFLACIKILTSVADVQERELLLNAMIAGKVLVEIRGVTPLQLCKGCNFLKKKQGQDLVRQLRLKRKLERRITGTRTVKQMGLLRVFEVQMMALATEIKELRRKSGTDAECQVEKVRAKFFPAGAYVEMYGNAVQKDVVLQFLADPVREAGLKSFLENRIPCCPPKESERLRILMSVVFGTDVGLPSREGVTGDAVDRTDGEVAPEVGGAVEPIIPVEEGSPKVHGGGGGNLRPRPVGQSQADSSRQAQRRRHE
ncbi:unnamed protein product [Rhodiola kirilowii]